MTAPPDARVWPSPPDAGCGRAHRTERVRSLLPFPAREGDRAAELGRDPCRRLPAESHLRLKGAFKLGNPAFDRLAVAELRLYDRGHGHSRLQFAVRIQEIDADRSHR